MGLLFVGPNYGSCKITHLAAEGDFTFASLDSRFISVCCRAREIERIILPTVSKIVYLAVLAQYLMCVQANGSLFIFDKLNSFSKH